MTFRVVKPKFVDILQDNTAFLNKDKVLVIKDLSNKMALCSDDVAQYWMGAPLIPAYQKAPSYVFREGLASMPAMTALALFDVKNAAQISKTNPLKIILNKPNSGAQKIIPIGFNSTKKDYFPIGKQVDATTIEIYEIPTLVKTESPELPNVTCIFFKYNTFGAV
jgi:hypothetical protein